MKKYKCAAAELVLSDSGNFTLVRDNCADECIGDRINFGISVGGGRELSLSDFAFDGAEECGKLLKLFYKNADYGLLVTTELELADGVIAQRNTVKNTGAKSVMLTKFSSAALNRIAYGGDAWHNKDLTVYICTNDWQCEGQWHTFAPSQLGLCPSTVHPWECKSYSVGTVGSWSTSGYYPLVMVEDKGTNSVWFMETEGSHSWQIKLSAHGGYAEPDLSLTACGCDEALGGWHYNLKPGEQYSAERAFFGVAEGGFEGAVSYLNAFKRADSLVKYPGGEPPIVFNDYMNCLWLDHSFEKVTALIEKAADVGCDVFCIDDGWQTNKDGRGHGDWIPRDKQQLKKIADKIKSLNMIPGIWFELDACMNSAYGYKPNENWVLKRYDTAVGGERAFYNFRSKEATDYLFERVKEIYDMGFRFIKNDYNQSTGIGCTNSYDGTSAAEGLIQNTDAFYEFINSLYDRLPGLVIENCGSGAMRDDNKMLRRAAVQSTSDQEIYLNNPSVMMGSMTLMPPEKAGVWAYPYPLLFDVKEETLTSPEYKDSMKNGFETSFNMINAMFGAMYLSGRIDMCDEFNLSLIKVGVRLYKKLRAHIPNGRPVYPNGICRINEKGTASFGILDGNALLLAVWNINGKDTDTAVIDTSKYLDSARIASVYPQIDGVGYSYENGVLTAKLSKNSAMFFELAR